MSGLSIQFLEEVREYLSIVGEIFGSSWVIEQSRKSWPNRHSLSQLLFGVEFRMPPPLPTYTLAMLNALGDSIEHIKNLAGFNKIAKRLRNKDEFDGAVLEMEVAAFLSRSGLNVILFPEEGGDLAVEIGSTRLYFESTQLQSPRDVEFYDKAFLNVLSCIHKAMPVGFDALIRFDKVPPEFRHSELKRRIVAVLDGALPKVVKSGDVRVKIKKNRDKTRGSIGRWGKVSFPGDYTRIRGILIDERKQLPQGKPGIVVIGLHFPLIGYEIMKSIVLEEFCNHEALISVMLLTGHYDHVKKKILRYGVMFMNPYNRKHQPIAREIVEYLHKNVFLTSYEPNVWAFFDVKGEMAL